MNLQRTYALCSVFRTPISWVPCSMLLLLQPASFGLAVGRLVATSGILVLGHHYAAYSEPGQGSAIFVLMSSLVLLQVVAHALAHARADGKQSKAAAPVQHRSSAASNAAPAAQQPPPAAPARALLSARMGRARVSAVEPGTGDMGAERSVDGQEGRAAARRPPPPPLVRQNASRNLLAAHRGHAPAKGALARAGSAPARVPLHALAGVFVRAH